MGDEIGLVNCFTMGMKVLLSFTVILIHKILAASIHSLTTSFAFMGGRLGILSLFTLSLFDICYVNGIGYISVLSSLFKISLLLFVGGAAYLVLKKYLLDPAAFVKDEECKNDEQKALSWEMKILDLIANQGAGEAGTWTSLREVLFSMSKVAQQLKNVNSLFTQTSFSEFVVAGRAIFLNRQKETTRVCSCDEVHVEELSCGNF
jgi:hypothetical protein